MGDSDKDKMAEMLMHIYNNNTYRWDDEDDTYSEDEEYKNFDYSRIAETLMRELVANKVELLLVLKDDEIREWWEDVLKEEKRRAAEAARREKERKKKEADALAKKELLDRLTPNEKRLLGIN